MQEDDLIKEALGFDPLYEAEKITGKVTSIDDNPEGFVLGLDFVHAKAHRMERLMRDTNDTYRSMPFDEFDAVANDVGFTNILEIPFVSREESHLYRVYWHYDHSILLDVDSYLGYGNKHLTLNGGSFYYNFAPDLEKLHNSKEWVYSSGHYCVYDEENNKYVWSGNHSVTNGCLRYYIKRMLEYGSFLKQWEESPLIYLTHHGDRKDYPNYDNLRKSLDTTTKERIAQLPKDVQDVINGAKGR